MASNDSNRQLITFVLLLLGALVLVPALLMGLGMMGFGMMGGMWSGGMWGSGGSAPAWVVLVGIVLQLLFLAAVVGAGYLIYRTLTGDDGSDPAFEELRAAYARGDLSDEEYERRRQTLERD